VIGVNAKRIQALDQVRLLVECAKLSAAWERLGRPDDEDMPRQMLALKTIYARELERRGSQLSLFDLD